MLAKPMFLHCIKTCNSTPISWLLTQIATYIAIFLIPFYINSQFSDVCIKILPEKSLTPNTHEPYKSTELKPCTILAK